MARIKRFRPKPLKKAPKPGVRSGVPEAPAPLRPLQPKLEGFTTPELEEIEAVSEKFARVQDHVKAEKKKLQDLFDAEEAKVIEVMQKYGREALVIGGYTIQIVKTTKAKVKGNPPRKDETASRDHEDEENDPVSTRETADDTTIDITAGGRSVRVTPEQMKRLASAAGAPAGDPE